METSSGNTTYEVEIEVDDQEKELIFDADGNFIKEEADDDDDD